jgi:hypothetical protein
MLALLSPELQLMLAPSDSYRRLVRQPPRGGRELAARSLLVVLVLGTSVALAATGRVSLGLVLSCSLCWSLPLLAQALALAVVARPSPLPYRRLLELFLLAHAPWSLWLLCYSLAAALTFPEGSAAWTGLAAYAVATALIPLVWTSWIVFCFFRTVLSLPTRRALLKTIGYELVVWSAALAYVSFAVALEPRLRALL